jgi:hypothetical protein
VTRLQQIRIAAALVPIAMDRPKDTPFADAGELEPIVERPDGTRGGVATVRHDLRKPGACPTSSELTAIEAQRSSLEATAPRVSGS